MDGLVGRGPEPGRTEPVPGPASQHRGLLERHFQRLALHGRHGVPGVRPVEGRHNARRRQFGNARCCAAACGRVSLGSPFGGDGHRAADLFDGHAEPPCQFPGVPGADTCVTDLGHHRGGLPQGRNAALDGVEVVPLQRRPDGKFKQRTAAADQVTDGGVAPGLPEVAGVRAGGFHCNVGLRDESLVLLEGAQGGLLAGGIAVEGEDDFSPGAVVGQQPPGDLDVVGAERGSTGGHCRRDPRQVAGHDVGVTLHHHQLPFLGDVPLGEVDAVEHLGLLVERGFRGIEVLGALIVLIEFPGAEADGVAGDVTDGPDQAAAEPVIDTPVAFGEHARQLQLGIRVAPAAEVLEQRVPALRGIADAELFSGCPVEAAAVQEVASLRGGGGQQLGAEELVRHFVGVQEALALAHVLAAGAGAAVFVAQFEADPGGQLFHGLMERGVVQLLDKGDDVAVLAAAEAVVPAHLGTDGERRRTLIVERAQALEGAQPGALERDVAVHDFLDVRALAYFVNIFAFDQPGHRAILVPGYDAGSPVMVPVTGAITKATAGCRPTART
ncbi:hypothetical protein D9M72_326490 [compost metagenome]